MQRKGRNILSSGPGHSGHLKSIKPQDVGLCLSCLSRHGSFCSAAFKTRPNILKLVCLMTDLRKTLLKNLRVKSSECVTSAEGVNKVLRSLLVEKEKRRHSLRTASEGRRW